MTISKKILSVLLAACMLFSFTVNGFAKTQASLEEEIAKKEKEIQDYQNRIDSLQSNAAKQDEYIDELQKQIHAYDDELELLGKQIDELNEKIGKLDGEIAEYEAKIKKLEDEINSVTIQIEEKQVEVDKAYELLSERLCASYMAGETSELEIFLTAKDFSDFIERTELMYQIAKHDTSLVEGLKSSIDELNKMIESLNTKKADLEDSKVTLDNQRAILDESRQTVKQSKAAIDKKVATIQEKVNKVNSYMNSLNKQSEQYKKLIDKANAEKAAFKIEIDNLVNNVGSTGSGDLNSSSSDHSFERSTKGMICPLQGAAVEIREYSWNHEKRGYHNRATDMGSRSGSSYGRAIYAVADGKVLKATYSSVNGNYLLIDHGSGVVTYYGHCSSLAVASGASVKQGQIIGYVGSTGVASGPHLHFELRVNGTQVYPENYLKRANGSYVSPIG